MRSRGELYYELRITFGLTSLLPLLCFPLYALLYWYLWTHGGRPDPRVLLKGFEGALPALAAVAAAHLMTVEREAGFAELRSTYPENRWRMPLIRTATAAALSLGAAALGALLFRLAMGPWSLIELALPGAAPTLFLTGLALLAGNLSGSYWVGAGSAMGWWLFDLIFRGSFTTWIFLFARLYPPADVDYGTNRWLLTGLGVGLHLINLYVGARSGTR